MVPVASVPDTAHKLADLERSYIILTDYIKHYDDDYDDLDQLLPFAMFESITSIDEATNFEPYEFSV